MLSRKPDRSVLQLSTPPPDGSPRGSLVPSDWDADDEDAMSEDFSDARSRPVSLTQSSLHPSTSSPYCGRIPTLHEILTNVASPPFTLAAFTAHLSQNHCLENLEFIKDADRYKKTYGALQPVLDSNPQATSSPECHEARRLWAHLLNTYIRPNAPREVNLPADVRDALVALPNDSLPPPPHVLAPAVDRIIELMNESILLGFISEHAPSPPSQISESQEPEQRRGSPDAYRQRSRSRRRPSPVGDILHIHTGHRHTSHSHTSRGKAGAHNSSVSTASGEAVLTDDTASSVSAVNSPMTPPTTPPGSELGGTSPHGRNENTWKKMMGKFQGTKKPRNPGGRSDRMEE